MLGCSPNSPGPLGRHGRWVGGSVVENVPVRMRPFTSSAGCYGRSVARVAGGWVRH